MGFVVTCCFSICAIRNTRIILGVKHLDAAELAQEFFLKGGNAVF
jgi:hypothetical protein